MFMPVGTQGSLKGVTSSQMEELDCQIVLGNTYHLGHRPGPGLYFIFYSCIYSFILIIE